MAFWKRRASSKPAPAEPVADRRDTEAGGDERSAVAVDRDEQQPESGAPAPDLDAPPPQAEFKPTVPPVLVPRWIQLVVLPLALLGLWALARAAGPVLLIVLFASVIALILNPVVTWLERRLRVRRGFAILLVYLGGFAALGGIGVALANPIADQVSTFQHNVPNLTDKANKELASIQRWLTRNGIKIQIQKQGQTALQTLQKDILKRSGAIASFARELLQKIVTIGFDLVLVLVLSVYLLLYGGDIGRLVRRIMPPGDGTPGDDYPTLAQRAVSGYVRGQLAFCVIMGTSAALALSIFGFTGIFKDGSSYAIFFGGFYGLMELIPYVGPIIGPIPAVAVALFDHPLTALWVTLMFVALQQLEGHVVAPQVFRLSLRINPILIILALLIGFQIYGVAGALIALPFAAVLRETILYLRRHLVLEPWAVAAPGELGVLQLGPDRCPDCGARAGPADEFCRHCGASLEPRVRTPG